MRVAHGITGPRHIALNHVVQVSTLCRRACMNVAGCILANEQLVNLRIARRCLGTAVEKALRPLPLGLAFVTMFATMAGILVSRSLAGEQACPSLLFHFTILICLLVR